MFHKPLLADKNIFTHEVFKNNVFEYISKIYYLMMKLYIIEISFDYPSKISFTISATKKSLQNGQFLSFPV